MKKNRIKKSLRGTWVLLMSLVLVCMVTAAICIIAAGVYIQNYVKQDIDVDLDSFRLNFTSYILYEDPETGEEEILEQLYNKENRIWASIDEIPDNLQKAFIAVEDARHCGSCAYGHKYWSLKVTGVGLNKSCTCISGWCSML